MKKFCVTGKRIYKTKERAEEQAEYQESKWTVDKLRVYLCEFCGGFHLTHKKKFRGF